MLSLVAPLLCSRFGTFLTIKYCERFTIGDIGVCYYGECNQELITNRIREIFGIIKIQTNFLNYLLGKNTAVPLRNKNGLVFTAL